MKLHLLMKLVSVGEVYICLTCMCESSHWALIGFQFFRILV